MASTIFFFTLFVVSVRQATLAGWNRFLGSLKFYRFGLCTISLYLPSSMILLLKAPALIPLSHYELVKEIDTSYHKIQFHNWVYIRTLTPQSTNIPRVPQCLSPWRNWDPPPHLLSRKWVGNTLACGWGGVEIPIRTTREKAWHSVYSVCRTQQPNLVRIRRAKLGKGEEGGPHGSQRWITS